MTNRGHSRLSSGLSLRGTFTPVFDSASAVFSSLQHDICNLRGQTAYSQAGRRNSHLRSTRAERVIRNPVPKTCVCDSGRANSTFENRGPESDISESARQIRHLRTSTSKLTFRVSRPVTRFSDSGPRNLLLRFARPKFVIAIRALKTCNLESVRQNSHFEIKDLNRAIGKASTKVCNWQPGRQSLFFAARSPNLVIRKLAAKSVKVTSASRNCKSGCQPVALVFGEPAVKTCNVRTGGAKVQKHVGPFGIAKALHGIGLGAINNAVFRRIETERTRLVPSGVRYAGNRSISIRTVAFAGYPLRGS